MEIIEFNGENLKPFPSDTGDYNDLISLWLALCADLAYKSKTNIAEELKNAGFNKVTFFDSSGTQAFFAEHPGVQPQPPFSILSFRGTENDYKDIISDITVFKRTIDEVNLLRVHGGFLTSLRNVWGTLLSREINDPPKFEARWEGVRGISEVLDERQRKDRCLYFTGHSLGAAIATLAAYEFHRLESRAPVALYTFGSPRSGGTDFARYVGSNTEYQIYRIVNSADIVTRVPPLFFGFRHVGKFKYLSRKGIMIAGSPLKSFLDVGVWQTLLHIALLLGGYLLIKWVLKVSQVDVGSGLIGDVFGLAGAGIILWFLMALLPKILALLPFSLTKRLPFGFFTDHAIRRYCTKLANLLK